MKMQRQKRHIIYEQQKIFQQNNTMMLNHHFNQFRGYLVFLMTLATRAQAFQRNSSVLAISSPNFLNSSLFFCSSQFFFRNIYFQEQGFFVIDLDADARLFSSLIIIIFLTNLDCKLVSFLKRIYSFILRQDNKQIQGEEDNNLQNKVRSIINQKY
ncbi:unnamed protein product [Paramecium sonneborni]|uniref:Transmembrane protein n=1 Tax=Paramecium sonneborni TaxID=65129 RepID=A0A8S1Q9A6_9CILI|nr:unnamed protein product [Paramecium sonneborni]